jgi:hypothetical protein
MTQIQIALDESLAELFGDAPEQIGRSALEMIVLELYRRRELSVERAATLLGLNQLSFIGWSGALGVPLFDMKGEEWQRKLRVIDTM